MCLYSVYAFIECLGICLYVFRCLYTYITIKNIANLYSAIWLFHFLKYVTPFIYTYTKHYLFPTFLKTLQHQRSTSVEVFGEGVENTQKEGVTGHYF